MQLYCYDGPVYAFDIYIFNTKMYTRAVSKQRAYSNFCYRAKAMMNRSPNAKVSLDWTKLTLVDGAKFDAESHQVAMEYHQITMEELGWL